MKKKGSIVQSENGVVIVNYQVENRTLCKEELKEVAETLKDGIAEILRSLPYMKVHLSEIRFK